MKIKIVTGKFAVSSVAQLQGDKSPALELKFKMDKMFMTGLKNDQNFADVCDIHIPSWFLYE